MWSYSYKIKNNLNDRFYIGVRTCRKEIDIFGDSYFGSGKVIKQAINKEGLEHFTKEMIFVFPNFKAALQWEAETVTQKFLDENPLCYNVMPGGQGGDTFTNNTNKEKLRAKRSAAVLGEKNPMKRANVRAKFAGKNNSMKRPEQRTRQSARMLGENNPMKRAAVREKISGQNNSMSKTNRENRQAGQCSLV